jgi:effector-binding domain-containing protein/ribosome-associated toxin RatA of RatAB toxin-antitoxin module
MKIFKRILLIVVVVIAAALLYVLFQPSEYNVSRSRVIKAPVSAVFNTVNEMRTWEEWGPWHDEDSTIVVTYGETTSGEGAYNSWTSKDGPGNMKTVTVVPNKRIEQKMQFGEFDPSDVIWTFEEVEDGTKVTWHMKEDDAPFIFKMASAMSGGWDGMLGPMEEQGLENLEEVVLERVSDENSFRIGEVTPVTLEAKKFIGIKHTTRTDIGHEEMTKLFMSSMPKVGMHAEEKGLADGDYTPGAVYLKWDEETKEAEFYIGLLLNKDLEAADGMEILSVPAGKGVMVTKYGNYGNGDMEAHAKIAKYMAANNMTAQGLVWELYENDPIDVQPQDIQTDIYYLLN